MTISSHVYVLALAMSVATTALAQSTSRVGQAENPLRLEVSAGYDRTANRYLGDPSTVVSGAVAVRWSSPATWVGIRGTVYGIQRRSHYVAQYSTTESDAVESEDRVLALTVAADASFRIWRDLTIAPSVGAGFSPYAHGTQSATHTGTPSAVPNSYNNYSRTENGAIWTAGVALRYRHLVIEKQIVALLGATYAVSQNREYYPLSIGFRF
jgi:hypothetical protein